MRKTISTRLQKNKTLKTITHLPFSLTKHNRSTSFRFLIDIRHRSKDKRQNRVFNGINSIKLADKGVVKHYENMSFTIIIV